MKNERRALTDAELSNASGGNKECYKYLRREFDRHYNDFKSSFDGAVKGDWSAYKYERVMNEAVDNAFERGDLTKAERNLLYGDVNEFAVKLRKNGQ